jgi:hypothetical protein
MAGLVFIAGGLAAVGGFLVLTGGMYPSIPTVRIDQIHFEDEEFHTRNYAPWFRKYGPHDDWCAERVYMPMLQQVAKDVNISEQSRDEYARGREVQSRSRLVEFREWRTSWHRLAEYVTGNDYTSVKMTAMWENDRFVMDVHKDTEKHMRKEVEKLNKKQDEPEKKTGWLNSPIP